MGNLYIFGQKNTGFLYLPIDLGLLKKKKEKEKNPKKPKKPNRISLVLPIDIISILCILIFSQYGPSSFWGYPTFLCPAVFTAFPCSAAHKLLLHFISNAKAILGSYREHPLLGQKCSPLLTFSLKCFRPCELTEEFSPLT